MKAIVLLLVAACGTYSTYKTTRIAPAGKTELIAGLDVTGAGTVDAPGGDGDLPLPELALSARRAVVPDRVEAQVNATGLALRPAKTGSLELAGKVRLASRGRWSLATGGGVGYRIADAGGAIIEGVYASLPVIAGVELGRNQLVVSATGGYQRWYSSGARPIGIPFVGESLGFIWQVKRNFALFPEVGTAWSPTRNFMTDDSKLFQLGVAVMWAH